MPRGMSSWGTYRRGRTVRVPDWQLRAEEKCGGWVWMVLGGLALVGIPMALFFAELTLVQHRGAFDEVKGTQYTLPEGTAAGSAALRDAEGRLVHLPAARVDATVGDPAFSFVAPALRLERYAQYCQWSETSTEHCDQCPDGRDSKGKQKYKRCNCVRTYHYHLGWRSHRINSLLFNQPAAHYNPQRDPFPSDTFRSEDAKANGIGISTILDGTRLLAPSRPLAFSPGARRPPYGFFEKLWSRWTGWQDATLYGDLSEIADLPYSAAGREGFRYVGNGGWFFSPHERQWQESLLKALGGLMEGSLMDWQIGDLVPSCHAGDIRVHYYVKDPEEASVAGKFSGVEVVPYPTKAGHAIGMVHAGYVSFDDMAKADIWEQKKYALFLRVVSIFWGWIVAVAADKGGSAALAWPGVFGLAGLLCGGCQFLAGASPVVSGATAVVSAGLVYWAAQPGAASGGAEARAASTKSSPKFE